MPGAWWRWWSSRRAAPERSRWDAAAAMLPWTRALDTARLDRLYALGTRFLREKTITPLAGLCLDEEQRMRLAALCCLPLLEFGAQGLHGWSQLLVYPGAFGMRRHQVDAAGVVHEWEDAVIGEAWERGPLILSWADVEDDIAEPDAGICVGVHEMAHKLDALDGLMDGTPPLPRQWQQQWAADFQREYDRFGADVAHGTANGIDPYAAQSPEEFFAVVSEYHFSAPDILAARMPAVAAHLRRLYGSIAAPRA